jgi:endonuclease/exonuclease/phosphatase family metal-dependent hydrolase
MEFIGNQQPDLCILQEVDLNAKRTGNRNVAEVLASHFRFNYVFGIEFEELSQGTGTEPAFHGQAVFSRWPILEPRVLRFSRQSDFWRPRPYLPRWSILQPRKGGRIALIAELAVGHYRLVIYDLHLESQCDDGLRLWQLNEVVHDSLRYPMGTPVVLAGDLNTRTTPSPLRHYLLASGFQDACERMGCPATKPSGHTLDWIFIRGPAIASDTRVHQEIRASDHFPLSTSLVLTA